MTRRFPKMISFSKRFAVDEEGAVTVDWVVLTAAVVGLGIIVMNFMRPAIFDNAVVVISADVAAAAARP